MKKNIFFLDYAHNVYFLLKKIIKFLDYAHNFYLFKKSFQ